MSRETGSTHTYYSAFFDTVQDFFFGQIFQFRRCELHFLILLVVLHDDRIDHGTCRVQALLDSLNST